ncbi:hypothetical protein ACFLXD_06890 [Chloroflexota bacterium]
MNPGGGAGTGAGTGAGFGAGTGAGVGVGVGAGAGAPQLAMTNSATRRQILPANLSNLLSFI